MQPNDDEALAAQLLQTADVHERAALLGIDYDRLVKTNKQLRLGTYIAGGVLVVIVGVVGGAAQAIGVYPVLSVDSMLGVALSFVGALIPLFGLSFVFQLASVRSWSPLRQQVIGGAALSALWALGYFATVLLCPIEWRAGLALGFLLATSLLSLAGVQSLPVAIAKNHPKLLMAVRQQQHMPPHQTLLGYDARWLITRFRWSFVEGAGVALLIAFVPISVIPVVVARVAGAAAEAHVGWTDTRRGLMVAGAQASLLLIAGVAVALGVATL